MNEEQKQKLYNASSQHREMLVNFFSKEFGLEVFEAGRAERFGSFEPMENPLYLDSFFQKNIWVMHREPIENIKKIKPKDRTDFERYCFNSCNLFLTYEQFERLINQDIEYIFEEREIKRIYEPYNDKEPYSTKNLRIAFHMTKTFNQIREHDYRSCTQTSHVDFDDFTHAVQNINDYLSDESWSIKEKIRDEVLIDPYCSERTYYNMCCLFIIARDINKALFTDYNIIDSGTNGRILGAPTTEKQFNKFIKFFKRKYEKNHDGYKKFIRDNYKFSPSLESPYYLSLTTKNLYKHNYVVAGTGSGKTELLKSLIYTTILRNKESVLVLEPHGDLVSSLCRLKEVTDDRLVYIDPYLSENQRVTINPFYIKNKSERNIAKRTQVLVECFEQILEKDFSHNMEAILTPCINTLLRFDYADLFDLQRFFDDNQNEDLVNKGKNNPHESYANYFKSDFYTSEKTPQKRALKTRLQILLNDPYFAHSLTGSNTVDLEAQMNSRGKVILFKLTKDDMPKTLQPYGRFIISLIKAFAFQRALMEENERPATMVYLDEFQNFISPSISEILEESRKYKLFLTMAHQINTQLTPELRNTAISNSDNIIVGKNGYKTLSAMTREIKVSLDELEDLQKGEFVISLDKKPAIKIKGSTILIEDMNFGFMHYVNKDSEEYTQKIKHQISTYYTRKDSKRPKKQHIKLKPGTTIDQDKKSPEFKPLFDDF